MRKSTTWIVLGSVLFATAGCRDERPDATNAIIGTFSGSCGSAGIWTQAALAQTESLARIYRQLRDTDACKKYVDTLGSLENASKQLANLVNDPSTLNYRLAEEKLQELTAAADAATDPALKAKLAEAILSAQVQLLDYRSQYQVKQDPKNEQYARAAVLFNQETSRILKDSAGMADCLRQTPAAGLQVAANIGAVAGSFVSPAVGAGAVMLAQVVALGVESARTAASSEDLWRVNATRMPEAMACGYEAMSSFFCQARDAFALNELANSTTLEPRALPQNEVLKVIDLLGRRLPVALRWLERVRSGGSPDDSFDADRRNQVLNKLGRLLPMKNDVEGSINESERLAKKLPTEDERTEAFVMTTLGQAMRLSSSNGGTNPFADLTRDPWKYACYLLKGYPAQCPNSIPESNGGGGPSNGQIVAWFKKEFGNLLSFSNLRSSWEKVYIGASDLVNRQFSETIVIYPQGLLKDGGQDSTDNFSPVQVFEMLRNYTARLLARVDEFQNPQMKRSLEETLAAIDETITIMKDTRDSLPNPCPSAPAEQPEGCGPSGTKPYTAADKLAKIAGLMRLQTGTQFLTEQIHSFAEADLLLRLKQGAAGGVPSDLGEILRSVGGEIHTRLTSSGITDPVSITNDLNSGQRLARENLRSFNTAFFPSLERAVTYLREQVDGGPGCTSALEKAQKDPKSVERDKALGEKVAECRNYAEKPRGTDRMSGQILGRLCLFHLSIEGRYTNAKVAKACQGAVVESPFWRTRPELSILVDEAKQQIVSQPPEQRLCTYWRYLRANRLAAQNAAIGRGGLLGLDGDGAVEQPGLLGRVNRAFRSLEFNAGGEGFVPPILPN